jgi:hypothetical protein
VTTAVLLLVAGVVLQLIKKKTPQTSAAVRNSLRLFILFLAKIF